MTLKQGIVTELGGADLLVPDLIARSLQANDQIKYYFALLQTARSNADQPRIPPLELKSERVASKVSDAFLDDVVAGTQKDPKLGYSIPRAAEVLERIKARMTDMLACLPTAERAAFETRIRLIEPPKVDGGFLSGAQIDAMTSGDRDAGDSIHLIVMDAHRAINKLQATIATETIDGAHVYGLKSGSRPLVAAFMKGLNRTAPLKFNHPGLETTATEHGGQLLIQNDIGTTDAHVLIVRVENRTATLTYTDIHRARLTYLQSLLSKFDVQWDGPDVRTSSSLESGTYLLTTGTFRAADDKALEAYLEHLGSRLVFLIDWNHIRKRLRSFVGKRQAIDVLTWAADNDYGHRGLIEIGGERALAEAVEYAAGQPLRYGDRLDDMIGEAAASDFLRHAMKIATRGLLARRSRRAVVDEIKAELVRHFENARLAIFDLAARHAACGYDIAVTVREGFEQIGAPGQAVWAERFTARAAAWEARADQLLNEARDDIKRFSRPASLSSFMNYADDAVDELEEAASLFGLLALVEAQHEPLEHLQRLSDIALESSQEFVKCVECAATVTRIDLRDDLDDFLQALERLIALEHDADEQIRRFRRALILGTADQRTIYLRHQLSQGLESATDAYTHAGQSLRHYLMEEVIA